jgi:hypothetical protein
LLCPLFFPFILKILSRANSAPMVFISINLKLSHQVEINQAFSLKELQNLAGRTQVMLNSAPNVRLFKCSIVQTVRLFKCPIVQPFDCSNVQHSNKHPKNSLWMLMSLLLTQRIA